MWLRERARLRRLAERLGKSEDQREHRDEQRDFLVGGIDVSAVACGHGFLLEIILVVAEF